MSSALTPVEQAWSLRLADPAQAHALASSSFTDPHEASRAQSVLAHLAWRDGRYAEALEYAESAEVSQRQQQDTLWLARTLNSIGMVHLYLGQHDAALGRFQDQLVLAQALQDVGEQAGAYNDLGMTLNSYELQLGVVRVSHDGLDLLLELVGELRDGVEGDGGVEVDSALTSG